MNRREEITDLLIAASGGDRQAMDRLIPVVYDELRRIAHRELAGERANHTLNTTALVHEAYLRLAILDRIEWKGRAHFFGLAARLMRQILVNHAVSKRAQKRGGAKRTQVPLEEIVQLPETYSEELIALDAAMKRLEGHSERSTRVVECRFFGGLNIEETAAALEVSPATVKRDWEVARAWLNRELTV
jgi:RNA polymerase sigma factor (TIGR02999 family)